MNPLDKGNKIIQKEIFKNSILGLVVRDKNGCTLAHWAAFRDAEFLLKFLFRSGCNFSLADDKGLIAIERGVENNAIRCVHFLDSHSRYPFQTNFFLHNKFIPVEFDFLPSSYSKIESCFESEALRSNFLAKKNPGVTFGFNQLKYLYSKFNLKYKFGLVLYAFWVIGILLNCVCWSDDYLTTVQTAIFVIFSTANCIFGIWFYK